MTTMKPIKENKEIKSYYYECGKLYCTEDKKNGVHTFYDLDRNIKEIHYFNGSSLKKVEKYYRGIKTEDCPYVGNLKNGKEYQYYVSSGTVMNVTEYKNGERNGKSVSYYPNGALIQESCWKNDKRHGASKVYTEASRNDNDLNNDKYIRQIKYYLDGKEVTIDEFRKVMPLSGNDIMPNKITFNLEEMSPQVLKNEGYTTYLLADQNDKYYKSGRPNLEYYKKEYKLRFYWVEVYIYCNRIIPLRQISLSDDITTEYLDELFFQSKINFEGKGRNK